MKTIKLFLLLFVMTAFGTTEFFAQTIDATTPTTKPKRKYTKKSSDATTVTTSGPVTTNTSTTIDTKPKRTYTKRTTVTTTTPATTVATPSVSTTINTDATKPKRTYTRKTNSTTVTAPATTVSAPATTVQQTITPRQTVTKTVKQTYNPSNGGTYNGHQVLIGPKGGKYYINKNGNKTYIK